MSRYANFDAPAWVARNSGQTLSSLGKALAYIVSCAFGGAYNAMTGAQARKGVWNDEHHAQVTIRASDIATFDHDELTTIVYLAYRLGVRVAIRPAAPDYIKIIVIPINRATTLLAEFTDGDALPSLAARLAKKDAAYGDWPERLTGLTEPAPQPDPAPVKAAQ